MWLIRLNRKRAGRYCTCGCQGCSHISGTMQSWSSSQRPGFVFSTRVSECSLYMLHPSFKIIFQILVSGHLHDRQHRPQHAPPAHLRHRLPFRPPLHLPHQRCDVPHLLPRDEVPDGREADVADFYLPRSQRRLHASRDVLLQVGGQEHRGGRRPLKGVQPALLRGAQLLRQPRRLALSVEVNKLGMQMITFSPKLRPLLLPLLLAHLGRRHRGARPGEHSSLVISCKNVRLEGKNTFRVVLSEVPNDFKVQIEILSTS